MSMFRIAPSKRIRTDAPLIVHNYLELLVNEMPILFAGTNRFGNTVIGSSVDEDYRKGIERFFHIVVGTSDYFVFLRREITYRSLLERAAPIYVLDRIAGQDEPEIYQIEFDTIPAEYRPHEESFCPRPACVPSHSYSVSLEGGLADRSLALPEQAARVQNRMAKLLTICLNTVRSILNIEPMVLQSPASGGSFDINFTIEIKEERGNLYAQQEDYFAYVNSFVEYCLNALPKEVNALLAQNFSELNGFRTIIESISRLKPGLDTDSPTNLLEISQGVYKASSILQDLAEDVGRDYTTMAIVNDPDKARNILGIIGEAYKHDIEKTVLAIEEKTKSVAVDEKATPYTVYIYDLNTDTRTGHAYVQPEEPATAKKVMRPRIKILGSGTLSHTKYTQSIYEEEYIDVQGRAKKVDGLIKHIDIEYEP